MTYKVPFVNYPLAYRTIKREIDEALKGVLEGGDFILRHQLTEFEQHVAEYIGVKYAIGVNSGTDALWLSLLALGIGKGDEVITVAHTFVASVAVIKHCGAIPVLVDVGQDGNMSASKLEEAITPNTKAIMPVHLNGRCCDMVQVMSIAKYYKLKVIEDAAQALGSKFVGLKAGTFGDASGFSFYPAKALGCFGDGGIITTNNQKVNDKVRLLRDHCQDRATGEFTGYGFNSRLDNLQAAILDVKLKHLDEWIETRRRLAAWYNKGLKEVEQISLPEEPRYQYHDIFTNYVIRAKRRDELAQYLKDSGIETIISWAKPIHKHKALGLTKYHLPETEKLSDEVISLPLYPELTNEQIEYVARKVKAFYA